MTDFVVQERTLGQILDEAAARFPDRDALVYADRDYRQTWREFSDPVADGPVVEAASVEALKNGVTLRRLMEGLRARKGRFKAGLVLMGYMNPFLQYGLDKLATEAQDVGVHGLIVPDLPYDEAGDMRAALSSHGLALIPLVGPTTSEERMTLYADVSEGYV